jgi:ribosomal protein S18 acetylase RimI-like enzyme
MEELHSGSAARGGEGPHRASEIRRASADDVPALVALLARAFDEDPVLDGAIRRDARRAAAFRRFFALALQRLTLPSCEVYTTADRRGAALWAPPGRWRQGPLAQVRQLPDWAQIAGLSRLPVVCGPLTGLLRQHPHAPHYYLFFLGVDPPCRGQGLGTALLRPVLERCDRAALPAYLENTNARNLPLYERHGFRVTREVLLAEGGPMVWPMWRVPG